MPIEDQKLDSLRPGSREMERGCWEGQNFQLGSSAPGRRRSLVYCIVLKCNVLVSAVPVTDKNSLSLYYKSCSPLLSKAKVKVKQSHYRPGQALR